MSQDSKLPPLERYTRILELLASFPDGLALTEIARMLALPKTSAHRLLGTMQDSQLVDLAASTYVLGARVKRLAYASADTEWIGAAVRPHLADLAAETDETCYLAKLHSGHQVSSVLMEAPDTPWRGFLLPGKGMAPHRPKRFLRSRRPRSSMPRWPSRCRALPRIRVWTVAASGRSTPRSAGKAMQLASGKSTRAWRR